MNSAHLPKGWRKLALGDIANVVRGSSPRPARDPRYFNGDHLPWITVADVTRLDGLYLHATSSKLTKDGADRTRIIEPGTVLLTNSGATLGVPAISEIQAGANDGIAAFLDLRGVDPEYLCHFLSARTRHFRECLAPGVGQPNLNTDIIAGVVGYFPPIGEQRTIADRIALWNEAASKLLKLIAAKRSLKVGLMQQLLTGKCRFPEFREEWVTSPIGKLLKVVERPVSWNDEERYRLLSIRRRSGGFFHREDKYGRDIKTQNLKTTHYRDFVIAKMQVIHGAMAMTPQHFDGMHVSDSYITFVPKHSEKLDIRFFDYLSRLPEFYHKVWVSSYGVTIEKMTFNLRWFLKEEVRVPPTIEEQAKIADALDACEQELRLLQQQQSEFQKQKQGLMQQLLTGKVRLPVSRDPVEATR